MKLGRLAVCKVIVRQIQNILALVRGLNFIEDLINKSRKSTVRQGTAHSLRPHKKSVAWHGTVWYGTFLYTYLNLVSLLLPSSQGFHCPGTFPIFKSWDFWTSLVPGPQDHGTFKVSRSCPVQSLDLGPLVPGLPRTSRDLFGRLFEKKKSIQRYMFFFLAKLLLFDCELQW